MQVSCIGRQLLDAGLITQSDLSAALSKQQALNPLVGEIAIELGFLDHEQVRDINIVQRIINKRFGDVAVSEGLITEAQLLRLLKVQSGRKVLLSSILIESGVINSGQLLILLKSNISVNENSVVELQASQIENAVFDSVEDVFSRVVHVEISHDRESIHTLSSDYLVDKIIGLIRVGFNLEDMNYLTFGIVVDQNTVATIAEKFLLLPREECDEALCLDAFCEYLNIIAGYVINNPATTADLSPSQAQILSPQELLDLNMKAVGFDAGVSSGYTLVL